MLATIDPSAIPVALAVAGACAVLVAVFVVRRAMHVHAERHAVAHARPRGAETALWSVTEAMPDPRNHIALKDPTSEMRIPTRS